MKKGVIKFILKLAISAGFLLWIIFKVKWSEVLGYVREISIWQILLYVSIFSVGIIISGYKWKLLAREKNIKFSLCDFSKFYLAGAFINNFMPSFVGGDTYRSYQIGKGKTNRYAEAASTVLTDRITGFIGTMVLVLLFSVLNAKIVLKNPILIIMDVLIIASFGTDVFIMALRKLALWKVMRKYIPSAVLHIASEIRSYNSNKKILFRAILLGVVFNFIGVGLANYVLFWAFDIQISLLNYLTVVFLISIVSAIPISINNIGVKEWAYITFFGIFGISASAVVAVAIVSRFLQMAVSFLALPVYLKRKVKISKTN